MSIVKVSIASDFPAKISVSYTKSFTDFLTLVAYSGIDFHERSAILLNIVSVANSFFLHLVIVASCFLKMAKNDNYFVCKMVSDAYCKNIGMRNPKKKKEKSL